MTDSYDFWEGTPEEIWWSPYVKDFKQASYLTEPVVSINAKSPKDAARIQWSAFCRAPCINVTQYLQYLQQRATALGCKVIKASLPTDGGFEKALQAAEN